MKILIVSKYYPPLNTIASLRPHSWAKYWTREGHDVTVVTSKTARTAAPLHLPIDGCAVREVTGSPLVSRLKRWHSKLSRQAKGSTLRQLVRMADAHRARYGVFGAGARMPDITGHAWARAALRAAQHDRPWDLVVSTSAPYVTHAVAAWLRERGQARFWIADYRDLWTDHHLWTGLPVLRAWERRYEDRLMRAADVITTVSEPLARTLRARHGDRVRVIENGVDADDFATLDPAPIFPPDGKTRIVYTGTVYERQDPAPLLQALAEIASERGGARLIEQIEVIFATRSTARVARAVRRFGVSAFVRVLRLVPRTTALRMQRDADLLLFLPWTDPAADGILTGKVYEYLASGTPILLVGSPHLEAAQRFILDSGAGIRVPGVAEIKSFLLESLGSGRRFQAKRSAGVFERYSRRELAIELLSLARGGLEAW